MNVRSAEVLDTTQDWRKAGGASPRGGLVFPLLSLHFWERNRI